MKNSFIIYTEYREQIDLLNNEQKGILLDSLLRYQDGDELPEMDGMVQMCFSFIKARMDRDAKAYEEKCEKNRANVQKRWGTKKNEVVPDDTTVYDRIPTDTKHTDTDIDTDIDIDIKREGKKKNARRVIELYNSICTDLPKVTKLTDTRVQSVSRRLKDFGEDDLKKCFEKAQASDFLSGRSGKFKAGFDWLINPTNMTKVLEGNYENRMAKASPTRFTNFSSSRNDDWAELQRKLVQTGR